MIHTYPDLFRLLWHSMLPCYPAPELSSPSEEAHMLRQCSWQGRKMNCSEIFTPVITDTGVCCSFNPHSNLRESNYSQLVLEMQATHLNIMQISVSSLFRQNQVLLKAKK